MARHIVIYFDASYQKATGTGRVWIIIYHSHQPDSPLGEWLVLLEYSEGIEESLTSITHAELCAAKAAILLLKRVVHTCL